MQKFIKNLNKTDIPDVDFCDKRLDCIDYLKCLRGEVVYRTMRGGTIFADSDGKYSISYLEKVDQDTVIFEQIDEVIKEQGIPDFIPKKLLELFNIYIENQTKIKADQEAFFVKRLEQHRRVLKDAVKEHCDYTKATVNTDLSEFQKINIKYKYVLEYHNMICERHRHTDLKIDFRVNTVTFMYKKVDYVACIQIIEDKDGADSKGIV